MALKPHSLRSSLAGSFAAKPGRSSGRSDAGGIRGRVDERSVHVQWTTGAQKLDVSRPEAAAVICSNCFELHGIDGAFYPRDSNVQLLRTGRALFDPPGSFRRNFAESARNRPIKRALSRTGRLQLEYFGFDGKVRSSQIAEVSFSGGSLPHHLVLSDRRAHCRFDRRGWSSLAADCGQMAEASRARHRPVESGAGQTLVKRVRVHQENSSSSRRRLLRRRSASLGLAHSVASKCRG